MDGLPFPFDLEVSRLPVETRRHLLSTCVVCFCSELLMIGFSCASLLGMTFYHIYRLLK